jgi:hypothetical protein
VATFLDGNGMTALKVPYMRWKALLVGGCAVAVFLAVVRAGWHLNSVLKRQTSAIDANIAAIEKTREQIIQNQIVTDAAVQAAEGARINSQRILNAIVGSAYEKTEIMLTSRDTYELLDHNFGSVHDTQDREQVDCAAIMSKKTAVIMIIGQSNAGNYGPGLYTPKRAVFNFNFFDGNCYRARDPLLGSTGTGENFATRLGDKLIEAEAFEHVLLVPIVVGGTRIEDWIPGGRFFRRIEVAAKRLEERRIVLTSVLWHQGEGNNGPKVSQDDYVRNLTNIFIALRSIGVYAPIYVAQATICNSEPNAVIRAAQREIVNPRRDIRAGPDTDQIGPDLRYDHCHMSSEGVERHARLWFDTLMRDMP